MTTTVLKLSESSAFLKAISLKSIKDVRALDVDLLLVLTNGDQILISGGAMHALNSPDMALQFSDGQLPLARVFEQIERINVSPEATRPFYKGPMLLVVRDNTPDVADNYIDEATQTIANLGATPLRALVEANGVNQTVNVTALTELAVQKAGLAAGVTTLAGAPEVTTERINSANAAVGAFFKVDAIAGEVVPTHIANSQGVGIVNPAYNAAISAGAQNYGAALSPVLRSVLT